MKEVKYHDFDMALMDLQKLVDSSGDVSLYNRSKFGSPDCCVDLGINWPALGTKSIEETKEFIKKLERAIECCENFKYNGYKITF